MPNSQKFSVTHRKTRLDKNRNFCAEQKPVRKLENASQRKKINASLFMMRFSRIAKTEKPSGCKFTSHRSLMKMACSNDLWPSQKIFPTSRRKKKNCNEAASN